MSSRVLEEDAVLVRHAGKSLFVDILGEGHVEVEPGASARAVRFGHEMRERFERGVAPSAVDRVHSTEGAFWPTTLGEQYDPEIARRMNAHAKVVISRGTVSLSWQNSRQLAGDLVGGIGQLKAEPGKDIALLGSGSIVAQLTDAGLIDEYRLQLNAVILTAGKALFGAVRERCDLRLVGTRQFDGGGIHLRYVPQTSG